MKKPVNPWISFYADRLTRKLLPVMHYGARSFFFKAGLVPLVLLGAMAYYVQLPTVADVQQWAALSGVLLFQGGIIKAYSWYIERTLKPTKGSFLA